MSWSVRENQMNPVIFFGHPVVIQSSQLMVIQKKYPRYFQITHLGYPSADLSHSPMGILSGFMRTGSCHHWGSRTRGQLESKSAGALDHGHMYLLCLCILHLLWGVPKPWFSDVFIDSMQVAEAQLKVRGAHPGQWPELLIREGHVISWFLKGDYGNK